MSRQSDPSAFGKRLRSLSPLAPPPDGWSLLERRLQERSRRTIVMGLALAASLLIALAVVISPEPRTRETNDGAAMEESSAAITVLMERSRELESSLATLRPSIAVWDGRSAEQAAMLERGLSIVDFQLAYARPHSKQRLWQDRVELLSDLVRTHREAGQSDSADVISSEGLL